MAHPESPSLAERARRCVYSVPRWSFDVTAEEWHLNLEQLVHRVTAELEAVRADALREGWQQLVIDKMTALQQQQEDGRYLSAVEEWNLLLDWLRTAPPVPAPTGEKP